MPQSKVVESSSNNSFDLLNYEIQNKIKEAQVLPQDSASQFGLKSSVKDDFDSSHGDINVTEGYQSLKELRQYSIFSNQIENDVQSHEEDKQQAQATMDNMIKQVEKSIESKDNAGSYTLQCNSEMSMNNLGSSQLMNTSTNHESNSLNPSQNEMQDQFQRQMLGNNSMNSPQMLMQQQYQQQMMLQRQANMYPEQKMPSSNRQQFDIGDKSPTGSQDFYPQTNNKPQREFAQQPTQQPMIMNLGSLSQQQFKHMDQEKQRLQLYMMMTLTEQQA